MSSKNRDEAAASTSSGKKKFPVVNTSRKSKTPLMSSPSKDNTVKIAALTVADELAKTGAAATTSKRSRKSSNKQKQTTAAASEGAAPSSGDVKPQASIANNGSSSSKKTPIKKLAKFFKKPETQSKLAKKLATPNSQGQAATSEGASPPETGDAPLVEKDVATPSTAIVEDDDTVRDHAATTIQAAFRAQKGRRRSVKPSNDVSSEVEALVEGLVSRRSGEDIQNSDSVEIESVKPEPSVPEY